MAKSSICTREYFNGSDEKTRGARVDTESARMTFPAIKETIDLKLSDFPANILNAATFHGLTAKIGDTFAGAKGDAQTAYDDAAALIERLVAGDWVKEGEKAGPRVSLLVDAIARALVKSGETVDDERMESIAAKLKADKTMRDGVLENPVFKAEYEAIKAERAVARAKEAAKTAKGAEADLGQF